MLPEGKDRGLGIGFCDYWAKKGIYDLTSIIDNNKKESVNAITYFVETFKDFVKNIFKGRN